MASIIYRPAGATDMAQAVRVTIDEGNLPQTVAGLVASGYEVFHEDIHEASVSVSAPAQGASAAALVQTDRTGSVDMLMHGIYWFRHYDLDLMGAAGAAVRAGIAQGNRYVVLLSSDHFAAGGQHDGWGIMMGFAPDPASLPETIFRVMPERFDYTDISNAADGTYEQNETPWLVYNPDDPATPFWMYSHCNTPSDGSVGQETMLHKSSDLINWQFVGISHRDPTPPNQRHVGYQVVRRHGPGDWTSVGLAGGGAGWWSSPDGITFTVEERSGLGGTYQREFLIDGIAHQFTHHGGVERLEIGGRLYHPTTLETVDQPKQQAFALVPVMERTYEPAPDAAEALILLRDWAPKDFPTLPNYMQNVHGCVEDGIAHLWLQRGFYERIVTDGLAPPPEDTTLDYYAYVADPVAAARAAPSGVRASCTNGVVRVSCHDILPQSTYRLERGPTAEGPWSFVAESGPLIADNAPVADALNHYRLTTLDGGVPRGHRVVSVYAGAATSLIGSKHLTRIAKLGFDMSTVDVAYLEQAVSWLAGEELTGQVLRWVSPAFGVKFSSGTSVERIGDLVSTIRPYWGGDAYAWEGAGFEGALGTMEGNPAIVGAGGTHYALGHGRFNHIRRRQALGVSFGLVYDNQATANEAVLMDYGHAKKWSMRLSRPAAADQITAERYDDYLATVPLSTGPTLALAHHEDDPSPTVAVSVNAGARSSVPSPHVRESSLEGDGSNQGQRAPGGFATAASIRREGNVDDQLFRVSTPRGEFTFTDLFAFGVTLSPAQEASLYSFVQARLSGGVEKAIRADYGATGNGTTDDGPAFEIFAAQHGAETLPVTLDIEAGDYVTTSYNSRWFMRRFADLTVRGAAPVGGVWQSTFLSGVRTGGGGQIESNAYSVRLEAVSAGDTAVTVKPVDIAGAGRTVAGLMLSFPVGSWVMLSSYDMMGYGFPSNPAQCEFHRITAADPATGVLTLDGPALFDHPDDAPVFNIGGGGGVDHGGPATLYAMAPEWAGRAVIENMEWVAPNQTYMAKEFIEYRNCKTDDMGPGNARNVLIDGGRHRKIEVDKICETMTIRNADVSAPGFIQMQSSSPNLLTIEDTVAQRIDGMGREAILRRNTVTQRFIVGTFAYGATLKVTMEDNVFPASNDIADVFRQGATGGPITGCEIVGGTLRVAKHRLTIGTGAAVVGETITGATSGATARLAAVDDDDIWLDVATIAGGPFFPGEGVTAPSLGSATLGRNRAGREWIVPGAFLRLENANGFATGARVTGMTVGADGAHEIHTDVSDIPAYALPLVEARNHPCMDFTGRGNAGSDVVVSVDAHTNQPLGSVVKLWMGADGVWRGGGRAIGKVVRYEVNVTKIYTGSWDTLFTVLHRFGQFKGVSTVDGGERVFEPYVDLTRLGYRVWSQDGNSGQLGDDDTTEDCSVFLDTVLQPHGNGNMGLSDTKGGTLRDIGGEGPGVWPQFAITLTLDPTWRP